jgi:hypothetical protein
MIQLIFLEMTSNLIPLGKIRSGINPSDKLDVNDSIDLPGNDIGLDHAGKNQPSGKIPVTPWMLMI